MEDQESCRSNQAYGPEAFDKGRDGLVFQNVFTMAAIVGSVAVAVALYAPCHSATIKMLPPVLLYNHVNTMAPQLYCQVILVANPVLVKS